VPTGLQMRRPRPHRASGEQGFTVTATSSNGDTFTHTHKESGGVSRTCEVNAGNSKTGCLTGSR